MPTVLVLGGYGLIGSACCRALLADGFVVRAVGRSKQAARTLPSVIEWVFADLSKVPATRCEEMLFGVDVVINAAGALQDGPRDDLDAIHIGLVKNLCLAIKPDQRFVQISAAGVSETAATDFFRSKAKGDAVLQAAPCEWVIVRPTLVLSPDAYGGTALLRGAAALPGLLPSVLPDAKVQTVHVDDLAEAVVCAAKGDVPSGTIVDITEAEAHAFTDLLSKVRLWLGIPPAKFTPKMPNFILSWVGRIADGLGHLGWRSPLRSNALAALHNNVVGDPTVWESLGGSPNRSLDEALASLPATRQERLFARLYFALPLAIAVLSAFWIVSGLMALAFPTAAADYLADSGLGSASIWALVVGGALADIALGLAILWRRWCRTAALGMMGLAIAYLIGGLATVPALWIDPLGPMIKVIPAIALAFFVFVGVEDR